MSPDDESTRRTVTSMVTSMIISSSYFFRIRAGELQAHLIVFSDCNAFMYHQVMAEC